MSFRFSSLQVWLGAAAAVLSSVLVCSAQTGGKGRGWPIEFSGPKNGEATNDLNQLTGRKDGMKELEEDLFRPQQSFSPPSSLDGIIARPTRPQAAPLIQNKRVKELLERRKDWVFMNPEDLMATSAAEEILKSPQYGPDGQEKKEMPMFERFYRSLVTKQSGANNLMGSKNGDLFGQPTRSNSRDELDTEEESNLPGGLKESAEALKKQFEPGGSDNPFLRGATRGNLLDTFGLGVKPISKEAMQERQKYMDEYHTVVDPSWHPPAVGTPGNPLAVVAGGVAPAWKPTTGLPTTITPSTAPSPALRTGFDSQLDVVNPMLGPAGLPDVNVQALGQTRPTLALPKIESSRVAPVAPTFKAPSRSFR
jgi:hypothetical protein